MKFSQYLKFTTIECNKILFTWSANLPQSRQLEIQQKLSGISTSNIGDFYNVSKEYYTELFDYEVIAQKITDDNTLMIMFE